ncbi:hypothetical protein ACF06V_38140 [Streptomyces bobili]|uniref:hypothetical protein n=1 Tax=Streptomyces bobili TaxID=67280 RepID=UPI0036FB4830
MIWAFTDKAVVVLAALIQTGRWDAAGVAADGEGGCVVGVRSGRVGGPAGGGGDVQAEQAGDYDCGEFCGELEQGRVAGRVGTDADFVEASGEVLGGIGLACAFAWDQPGVLVRAAKRFHGHGGARRVRG